MFFFYFLSANVIGFIVIYARQVGIGHLTVRRRFEIHRNGIIGHGFDIPLSKIQGAQAIRPPPSTVPLSGRLRRRFSPITHA